jgi:hypothetical protein
MMSLTDRAKADIRMIYEALQKGETILGFDESREVGIISLVEIRGGKTHLMPVAEIKVPLVMPQAVNE